MKPLKIKLKITTIRKMKTKIFTFPTNPLIIATVFNNQKLFSKQSLIKSE